MPTVRAALAHWQQASGLHGEVIVVDNASTDATTQVAADLGARVIAEPTRGIGRARNSGAGASRPIPGVHRRRRRLPAGRHHRGDAALELRQVRRRRHPTSVRADQDRHTAAGGRLGDVSPALRRRPGRHPVLHPGGVLRPRRLPAGSVHERRRGLLQPPDPARPASSPSQSFTSGTCGCDHPTAASSSGRA
ncbi:glycosyltransferase [Nonomuraea ceibae]|uniref:glycosyltransferase n=1 Tax=Nonomuraea ceibae TaxID=1935170 RepID=UPI003557F765